MPFHCHTARAAFLCLATLGGGAAQATETFLCEQTLFARAGFTTPQVARSFYPAEIWFQIDGAAVPASYYGSGVVTPDGNRRVLSMDLTEVSDPHAGATMKIRVFPDGRATVWLSPQVGYVVPTPSVYQCTSV